VKLKLALIGIALILSSGASAQYVWDGYRWVWQGYGPPTRGYPPGPAYRGQIPDRWQDCGRDCVEQFHRFGGRDQRICFDQWGNQRRC